MLESILSLLGFFVMCKWMAPLVVDLVCMFFKLFLAIGIGCAVMVLLALIF